MKRRTATFGAAGLVLGLTAGVLFGTAASGQGPRTHWKITNHAESLFQPGQVDFGDVDPNLLIPAYADDGTLGYVRATDLFPIEASLPPGSKPVPAPAAPAVIPVYAEDGVTVIGRNTSSGQVSLDPADATGSER